MRSGRVPATASAMRVVVSDNTELDAQLNLATYGDLVRNAVTFPILLLSNVGPYLMRYGSVYMSDHVVGKPR
jgi:hypothetical protein